MLPELRKSDKKKAAIKAALDMAKAYPGIKRPAAARCRGRLSCRILRRATRGIALTIGRAATGRVEWRRGR